MSKESLDKAADALGNMVIAANHMWAAHSQLLEAGDKATAARLSKIRDDFRALRLEVTTRITENKR